MPKPEDIIAPEAEKAVLGAMMLDPRCADPVIELLPRPDCFADPKNKLIYTAILAMKDRGASVTLTTLCDDLLTRNNLDKAGGPAYIAGLEQFIVSTSNAEAHAKIVADRYRLRQLRDAGQQIHKIAHESWDSSETAIETATALLLDLSEQHVRPKAQLIESLLPELEAEIGTRRKTGAQGTGLSTGFKDLDFYLGGVKPEYIILAARPSLGKTALACHISYNIALKYNRPVYLFSVEMSKQAIVQRLLSLASKVPHAKIERGSLSDLEMQRIDYYLKELARLPIVIDDDPALSLPILQTRVRTAMRQWNNPCLFVVDFLTLVRVKNSRATNIERVSEVSRAIKTLVRTYQKPFLCISQMSRNIEHRIGKHRRPQLSDLRDSGSLEEDADKVLFLHKEPIEERPECEIIEAILAKNRNGLTGVTELLFFGATMRYESIQK